MLRTCVIVALGTSLVATAATPVEAAPYTPVVLPPFAVPTVGPGVILPKEVFGKEYSRNLDDDFMGILDPERVVAWDGLGGTLNGLKYSGSRPAPPYPREQEVDALANVGDALFNQTMSDRAHLIFSHDQVIAVPAAGGPPVFAPVVPLVGPVALSNGDIISGAAEVSVEESGGLVGFEIQHGWATIAEIQSMADPRDLDGLEVWGPEPGVAADSDKYSLEDDVGGGVGISVFSYDLAAGISSGYIPHATIVTAVESLLGIAPTTGYNQHDRFGREAINLDALMVRDGDNVPLQFGGAGDKIIFSISQIVNPVDLDGYYATGSELFILNATPAGLVASYLRHGGHLWDHAYTLAAMKIQLGPDQTAIIDIDAIEAVGELVEEGIPEPGSLALLSMAGVVGFACRRHHCVA